MAKEANLTPLGQTIQEAVKTVLAGHQFSNETEAETFARFVGHAAQGLKPIATAKSDCNDTLPRAQPANQRIVLETKRFGIDAGTLRQFILDHAQAVYRVTDDAKIPSIELVIRDMECGRDEVIVFGARVKTKLNRQAPARCVPGSDKTKIKVEPEDEEPVVCARPSKKKKH